MGDSAGALGRNRASDGTTGESALRHGWQEIAAEGEEAIAEIAHVGVVEDPDQAGMVEKVQAARMVREMIPEMRHDRIEVADTLLLHELRHRSKGAGQEIVGPLRWFGLRGYHHHIMALLDDVVDHKGGGSPDGGAFPIGVSQRILMGRGSHRGW